MINYLEKAQDALTAGFTSKAAQKTALDYVGSAYRQVIEKVRSVVVNNAHSLFAADQDKWNYLTNRELPLYPHQYRSAKHDKIVAEFGALETVTALLDLHAKIKAAEIGAKATSITKVIEDAETKARKDLDDGFRASIHVSTCFHSCRSVLNNSFLRWDWYKNGRRTAFQDIVGVLAAESEKWAKAGHPNMSEWSRAEIKTFYT
jgi:hypothetical protein